MIGNESIILLEKDVKRHESEIKELANSMRSLADSQKELSFLVHNYMENLQAFGKKIDRIADVVEGKAAWEQQKLVQDLQTKVDGINRDMQSIAQDVANIIQNTSHFRKHWVKYVLGALALFFFIGLAAPEAFQNILGIAHSVK